MDSNEILRNQFILNPLEHCETRAVIVWLRLIVEVIFLLVTVTGNFLVILSIFVVKALRQPRNYLILSLAVADLLVGLVIVPFKINLTENCENWTSGSFSCYIWISGDALCSTASILALTVISLDRYIAIGHPLYYKVNCTGRRAFIAIVGTWILSFLLTIPHFVFGDLYHELQLSDDNGTSYSFSICTEFQRVWHQLIGVVGSFFLPLCAMIFVYVNIWRVLTHNSKTKFRTYPIRKQQDDAYTGVDAEIGESPQRLLERISEVLQERKGCVMIGVVTVVFIVCWLPFFGLLFVNALTGLLNKELIVSRWVYDVLVWLGYFNSCANPFIYTMFDDKFRYAFRELLCFRGFTLNSNFKSEMYTKQIQQRAKCGEV